MANKYIVRCPIKNRESQVIGHEILYYGEDTLYGSEQRRGEGAAVDTIFNFLTNNSGRMRGSLNFMTFTPTLLMKRVPELFDPKDLVIQLDDSAVVHPRALYFVQTYREQGYRIAVNDFQFMPRYLSLIDQIDYIRLNFETLDDDAIEDLMGIASGLGRHCLAYNINTDELYEKAMRLGVTELEGDAVAERLASEAHDSSYLESSSFQLLSAAATAEPDMREIEQIISRDASLSYALLRVANTVQFASRRRTTSVHQALMNMGVSKMQQWVYLLCASNSQGELDPFFEEFLKLSFMRANLCQKLLSHTRVVPITPGDAYLMGMFSTLDYLIDAPLEETLSKVDISEDVKNALLRWSGPAGALYALIISYESADWDKVNRLCTLLGIDPNLLTPLYFECMEQAEEIWKNVNTMSSDD